MAQTTLQNEAKVNQFERVPAEINGVIMSWLFGCQALTFASCSKYLRQEIFAVQLTTIVAKKFIGRAS